MKINMKNRIMGLLMLGTTLTATVACNSQKNNKAEAPAEDTVKVDSILKKQSDVATAMFKVEQANHKADSLLNEFKNNLINITDIDVNRLCTELSNALEEKANNLNVVTNVVNEMQSNN